MLLSVAANPAANPNVLCNDFADPSLSGFSVNYFGTSYNTVFINDNGTLSFGAAFAGSVSVSLLGADTPVIAGFFADGSKRFKFGYAPGTFSIDIDLLDAPGSFNVIIASILLKGCHWQYQEHKCRLRAVCR